MRSKETEPILDGSTEDERFFNRELSWLAFNERVLSLAEDDEKPLGERIRFLAISADNLNAVSYTHLTLPTKRIV